jgi:DUF1680 family protein
MRTFASLPAYLATSTTDGLQIHQYAASTLRAGSFAVDVQTDYPWDARVTVTVTDAPAGEVELSLRIPEWASDATVDDKPGVAGDYARVRRVFRPGDQVVLQLPLSPRLLVFDDRVDSTRGCVAVARGPLVYALEQPDQQPGAVLEDLRLNPAEEITAKRTDVLGGITVLHSADLTLIPYYAWANRGLHPMRVWIPIR